MFHRIVGSAGFGWATRSIAFVMLALSVVPIVGTKMRTKPPAARKVFDAAAWKEPHFTLYAISLFVGYMGMYIPFFYIQLYCLEKNIITGELNFYLLPILNASGLFGRLVSLTSSIHIWFANARTVSGSPRRQDRTIERLHHLQRVLWCYSLWVDWYEE